MSTDARQGTIVGEEVRKVAFTAEEEIVVIGDDEEAGLEFPSNLPEAAVTGDRDAPVTSGKVIDNAGHEEENRLGFPVIANFKDHFSLPMPSSRIRFRSHRSAARVIEQEEGQFILEETFDAEHDEQDISIKRIEDNAAGVTLLRAIYAIVTAFWTGFLLIFSLHILLFVTLDLVSVSTYILSTAASLGKYLLMCH